MTEQNNIDAVPVRTRTPTRTPETPTKTTETPVLEGRPPGESNMMYWVIGITVAVILVIIMIVAYWYMMKESFTARERMADAIISFMIRFPNMPYEQIRKKYPMSQADYNGFRASIQKRGKNTTYTDVIRDMMGADYRAPVGPQGFPTANVIPASGPTPTVAIGARPIAQMMTVPRPLPRAW